MTRVWVVALGGAIGSVGRYLLGYVVQQWAGASFPAGTLAVNALGCLLIGIFAEVTLGRPGSLARIFLMTGICGGFTTFSTFGYETVELLRAQEIGRACLNMAAQMALGIAGVVTGLWLGRIAR